MVTLKQKSSLPTVTFATTCWEGDWCYILQDEGYCKRLIDNHLYPFAEKLLIINNVKDEKAVAKAAGKLQKKGLFTKIIWAKEHSEKVLDFFSLKKEGFTSNKVYESVSNEWVYYNAIGPLTAIYFALSTYLLYVTADVTMPKAFQWITPSIKMMEKDNHLKVANPIWNEKYHEAKREAYKKRGAFFLAKEGFSDQCFLVRTEDFQQKIYHEIREDSHHFPRGDVFEKRVYSFMKNHGWERMIYRKGSYLHDNF